MAILQKKKVLNGRGIVCELSQTPEVFFYREIIKGTTRYRYIKIEGATSLEEAEAGALDARDELQRKLNEEVQVRKELPEPNGKEVLVSKVFNEKTGSNDYRTTVVVNSRRGKVRAISECVYDFLKNEEARCEAGLISEKTVKNKREVLTKQFLNYLEDKKVYGTNQITQETFKDYPIWRKAKLSTRKQELNYFYDFITNYLTGARLISSSIDVSKLIPKIEVPQTEVDANPPLIEPGNWSKVYRQLSRYRDKAKTYPNHRGYYFAQLFYRWCLIAKNCGLRPDVELNKLRWCDVELENVGRWSKSRNKTVDKWIAIVYVRQSKTKRQRSVPTNGVREQLEAWKKEQQAYIDKHCPGVEITNTDLIFCNPYNEKRAYSYSRFTKAWSEIMNELEGQLKPYVFSDRNYTIYSMRSTYVCNLIIQGKDIYTTAKLAGHSVAVCERFYAQLDLRLKAKDITNFRYGGSGKRKTQTKPILSNDETTNERTD